MEKNDIILIKKDDCVGCVIMDSIIRKVLATPNSNAVYKNIPYSRIDFDTTNTDYKEFFKKNNITDVPCILLLKDGIIEDKCIGTISEINLVTWLNTIYG